ncbi:MAG: hypothetical protein JSV17_06865 [Candidatus Aminicenantes bacterium]|nr:MAG: hypothetical protein JSV17_06865 [Candidatus Aminicenantes bacterium]
MKRLNKGQTIKWLNLLLILSFLLCAPNNRADQETPVVLKSLLPSVEGMKSSASPDIYFPESLFEYINGAAEIYLAYDFKELIVAEYTKSDSSESVSVEIYDMGNHKNSFGIYSAERYPDNEFMDLGTQGYMEKGALNFLVGRYYVKLLCYDCGERSDQWLHAFSEEIVNRVENKKGFPAYLQTFPKDGLIPNTEKFILRNVMGYKFLHDGYVVSYKMKELSFDCFLIEGKDPEEATSMLKKYLDAKGADSVEKISIGFRVKDRYYNNIYLAQVNNILCGVMKITDDLEDVGESYLEQLVHSVKSRL